MLSDIVTSPERRARYTAAGHWDATTLPDRLARWARERPDHVAAVDDGGGALTFAALHSAAAALARALDGHGIGAGDVVSVQLPNRVETVVAALGVLGVGATVNPLLPGYRHRELAHVFRAARPRAILVPTEHRGTDHRALAADVVADTGVAPVVVDLDALAGIVAEGGDHPLGREASAISELIFTSGTEATPKAIMHSEQTAGFSVRVAYDDLGLTGDDVVWMPSPVGHSTGFNYGLRFAVHHGLPLVLQDRWDPARAAELVTTHGCSYTLASTTFLLDLVEVCERRGLRLPTLTRFGCGGAPVPAELVDRAAAVGIGVLRLYGSTEVLVATWNRPGDPLAARRHTDGRPLSHVELDVRDGELFTRGPNTCLGFHDDPDRTAATFADGWVASGDLVDRDETGAVTVVGRKKEIIIRGGMNIAPREIEDAIAAFPEVDRVAVVGLPDERLGERTCACVVLRPGAARLDLETLCDRLRAGGMATYKLPQALEVVGSLPMTASGKVQKHVLVRQVTGS